MVETASILIADDEQVFRETTADLLRLRDYRCDCVAESESVLSALKDQPFDLVVADIRMPGNSGLQLVEKIHREYPGLPVILVTGAPSLDSAIRSIELPVVAYLTKPLNLESFYEHVDRCIARSTTRRLLHDVQQKILACARELEMLETEMSDMTQNSVKRETAETVTGAVRLLLETLRSLEPVWRRYASDGEVASVQAMVTSPRELAFQEAVEYGVLVLERTRKSFKSKELGELRQRLRRLLDESHA